MEITQNILYILSSPKWTLIFSIALFLVFYLLIPAFRIASKIISRKIIGSLIVLEKSQDEFTFTVKQPLTSTGFCKGCGAPYIQKNGCSYCGANK